MADKSAELLTRDDKIAQAKEFYARGYRNYVVGDFNEAAEDLSRSCELYAELFGDESEEVAVPNLFYGKTLIELAQGGENKVLAISEEEEEDDDGVSPAANNQVMLEKCNSVENVFSFQSNFSYLRLKTMTTTMMMMRVTMKRRQKLKTATVKRQPQVMQTLRLAVVRLLQARVQVNRSQVHLAAFKMATVRL